VPKKQVSSPLAGQDYRPCAFPRTLSSTIPLLRGVGGRLDGDILLPAALAAAVLRPHVRNIDLIQRLFEFEIGYTETVQSQSIRGATGSGTSQYHLSAGAARLPLRRKMSKNSMSIGPAATDAEIATGGATGFGPASLGATARH
jgi:hypothetical protein